MIALHGKRWLLAALPPAALAAGAGFWVLYCAAWVANAARACSSSTRRAWLSARM